MRRATPGNRVVAISDVTVAQLYGARIEAALSDGGDRVTVTGYPLEEASKTRYLWARITDDLLDKGFGRDTTIVAVGGGVVGDLVGFVAATYMRGVPFVLVPTTLLAMVDASIGGKTGVDTQHGKNLVGAFHQPIHVAIDPDVLRTLPMHQLRSGFAEVVKHGVVADASYFDEASQFAARWPDSTEVLPDIQHLIAGSVGIKADVVARDERESGLRKILNFGHTLAHAIESATQYKVLHGDAVAIGMVLEARIAEKLGLASGGTAQNIERVCKAAGLPTLLPAVSADALIRYTRSDKKAREGRVHYALPAKIGEMAGANAGWSVPVDDAVVIDVLKSAGAK